MKRLDMIQEGPRNFHRVTTQLVYISKRNKIESIKHRKEFQEEKQLLSYSKVRKGEFSSTI